MISSKRLTCRLFSALALSAASVGVFSAWLPSLSDNTLSTIRKAAIARAETSVGATQRNRFQSSGAHPLGVQILFVEAKQQKKKQATTALEAEVFLFDYERVQASVDIVDATTGELITSRLLESLQLPLNSAEADYATQLLRDHTDFFSALTGEYQNQFNAESFDRSSIDMKVSIWAPDARVYPDSACLSSRCALVSVFTPDHYNFSTEPVVDLVSGEIWLDTIR